MRNSIACGVVMALLTIPVSIASAAQGEMGTGVPDFGLYTQATGSEVIVWSLSDATQGFPSGCTYIRLNPATMGLDNYKIAVAMLIASRSTGQRVRFYAHAPRDGGCGVDYTEMQ